MVGPHICTYFQTSLGVYRSEEAPPAVFTERGQPDKRCAKFNKPFIEWLAAKDAESLKALA